MVTIASLDLASVSKVSSTPNSSTNQQTATKFSDTLQATTKAAENAERAVTTPKEVKDLEKATVPTEESTSNEESNVVLSLEYLLASTKVTKEEKTEEIVDFSALLQVTSVEDLVKLMGGKTLPEGEQLTLPMLADALNMSEQELQSLIQKMTGNQQQSTDVWDALKQIDEKLFLALHQLAATANGHPEAKLTSKEAKQAIAFLKLVELAGPKTDLALKQESQVAQMKNWVNTLSSQLTVKTAEKETVLPFAKTVVRFTPPTDSTQPIVQQPTVNAKVQTVTIQLPTTTTTQVQASKFVEEFQAVMNRAQFASNAAGTRMLIKLYPEHLGTIRIELIQKDGMLSAKLLASNALGKQMLDSTLHQLKQGLANQNIQLDRVDVTQALSETNKGERGHQFSGQQSSNEQKSENDERQKNVDETVSFEELLAEMEE